MAFWIFMLVMTLLMPLMMILFGKLFSKNAPDKINMAFGYRTSMSMKNKDTWEFAHHYFGKIWYAVGGILLPLSVIPLIFVFGGDEDTVGDVGAVICVIQMAALIIPIVPTELALRKRFDRYGIRR